MDAEELVKLINTEFGRFQAICSVLPDDLLCQPRAIGDWSIKDVMAHLSVWEKRLLQRVAGEPEDGAGIGTPQYNHKVYCENRGRTIEDVKSEFYRIHQEVITLAESLSEAEISKWQQAFRLNTFNHYKWASSNLRRWRRANKNVRSS